mgnify:CR=1 FL=1
MQVRLLSCAKGTDCRSTHHTICVCSQRSQPRGSQWAGNGFITCVHHHHHCLMSLGGWKTAKINWAIWWPSSCCTHKVNRCSNQRSLDALVENAQLRFCFLHTHNQNGAQSVLKAVCFCCTGDGYQLHWTNEQTHTHRKQMTATSLLWLVFFAF